MSIWRLQSGVTFRDEADVLWRFDRAYGAASLLFSSPKGEVQTLTSTDLILRYAVGSWRYDASANPACFEPLPRLVRRGLTAYSEDEQKIALYRLTFVRHFLNGQRPTQVAIDELSGKHPHPRKAKSPSLRSVQRWISAYKASRDVTALLDRRPEFYRKKFEPIEILDTTLDEFLDRKEGFNRGDLIDEVMKRVEEHNSKAPVGKRWTVLAKSTWYRRLKDLDQYEADRALLSPDEHRRRYRSAIASPRVNHPLERVEIDHALLDIIIVDETGEVVGRPWLTLALDYYTKLVVGFYLSLDPPSIESVLQCLRSLVLPKNNLLANYP